MTRQTGTSKAEALAAFDAAVAKRATQRKLVNIEVSETSGVDVPASGSGGWVVIKASGDPIKALEDAVIALRKAMPKLSRAQVIARLAEKQPDLVMKAEKARQAALDAAPVTKAADEPKTAQERVMALANELRISGRVTSVAAGVVLAAELYPELAEEALTENMESNVF